MTVAGSSSRARLQTVSIALTAAPVRMQHRPAGHAAGEVHGRERLAGARLAVQQDAPLDVPAGRLEPLGVPAEPDRVPLDPLQHHVRQDQPGLLDRRQAVELHRDAAVTVLLDRQDAAAEGRPVPGVADEPAEQPLGDVAVAGHHLDGQAAAEGADLLGDQQGGGPSPRGTGTGPA